MKKVLLVFSIILTLASCNSNQPYNQGYGGGNVVVNQPNVVVTPTASNLGDNLDLQALGELVKSSTNAQDIEQKLNTQGSINNLDLDGDGKIDYIKVTEYGNGDARGFSFTVDITKDEKQEIATVEIDKNQSNAAMNIQGNQQLYGQSAYYQSTYSFSDIMLMSYLFSYHSIYSSPYRYGYYPSYYGHYGCASYRSYHSRMATTTRTSTITHTTTTTSKAKSPNSSLSSKQVSARQQSLVTSSRSQKAFKPTTNSRPSTSGFGNSRSSSSSSKPSASRSSSSSGRSFGGSSRSSSSSRSSGGRRR